MKFSTSLLKYALFGALLFSVYPVHNSNAQTTVQEELRSRNLTLAQAREMARRAGVNPDDPEQIARLARANGASEEQIQQWLVELRLLQQGDTLNSGTTAGTVQDLRADAVSSDEVVMNTVPVAVQLPEPEPAPRERGLEFFGYNIFSNVADAFQPSAVGPADDGYVVGPDDQLRLSVWGATEFQYDLQVDNEGRVFIPNLGQLTIAGQRLSELRISLKNRLSQIYSGLISQPPTIFMDVTVTRMRPIKVFILGEVANPGGFTFPANSTFFNVLYGIGGPTTDGSLRDIRIIRNGVQVASIDLYDLLLNGIDSQSIPLLNNDRIFIPPRKNTIFTRGPVRRPAIYELKEGETIADLLRFAGGFHPEAYSRRFQLSRILPFEEREDPSIARRVIDYDLQKEIFGANPMKLQDGDEIRFLRISDVMDNIVSISGAVLQPGRFQLSDSIQTVRDLILAADSLAGDAYTLKGDLIRTNEDSTQTFFSFNVLQALEGEFTSNLMLQRRDRVRIFSRLEVEDTYTVGINGAVENPQTMPWRPNMRVYDLLFRAGGLFDPVNRKRILMERADIIRIRPDGRTTEVIPFNLEEALNQQGFGLTFLQPFDRITIYSNTVELIDNKFVIISGEVKQTGQFDYQENMTLEDLILRARGFNESSYLGDIEITRTEKLPEGPERVTKITFELVEDPLKKDDFYSVDRFWGLLDRASEFKLEHRDRVYIRRNPRFDPQRTISLRGEVKFPGNYTILREGETLGDVIRRAGGLTSEGYAAGTTLQRGTLNVIMEVDRIIRGDRKADIELREGDVITVPLIPNTVAVRGNVPLEGLIKYRPGAKLSYYLERSGGMERESEKHVLLTQASGGTFRVKRKGLFKSNPVVEDGATIRVVQKPPREPRDGLSPRELLQETTALLTGALTIILLVDRVFINR